MEKAIVLGSKDKTINTKIFREVLYEESNNIQYNKESWYRIKQKIRENNIDTVMGSKDNINIINRLLWECDTLQQYVLIDSDDAWQVEKTNDRRNMLRWDMVANRAEVDNSIEQAGWISSITGNQFSEKEMDEYVENALYKLREWCKKTTKVLEIGIASGLTCFKIAPLVGKYIGLDISEKTLEKTQHMLERKNIGNVELIQGGVWI